jgi:cytochrome b involved in lipid metabolism
MGKTTLYDAQERELKHFSGLLFGGDSLNTTVEFAIRALIITLGFLNPGGYFTPAPGAQSLVEVGLWMVGLSAFTRLHTALLEHAYGLYPQYRTQPPAEHALREKADLTGRELKYLGEQNRHDRWSLIGEGAVTIALFLLNPGYFPGRDGVRHSVLERLVRLIAHHYALSFTMYWAHRAGHVVPFKWAHVHGVHHQATHPLSRVTYQAHWFDNTMNMLYGHVFAQLLVPLDYPTYYFSLLLRVMESLEKHSGLSCYLNVAHNLQRWLPYSQMPHHHDLHHEGSKRCNFTFGAAGGLWDWAFGSRKAGRAQYINEQATAYDRKLIADKKAASEARARDHAFVPTAKSDAAAAADGKITLAELAEHKSSDSLWIAIGGCVYDVTSYVAEHPGGESVLADVAGRDATADFEDIGHSETARKALAALRIGELAGAVKTTIKTDDDSFWNSMVGVHAPIALMCALVGATGVPGALPLAAFCATVLGGEVGYIALFAK